MPRDTRGIALVPAVPIVPAAPKVVVHDHAEIGPQWFTREEAVRVLDTVACDECKADARSSLDGTMKATYRAYHAAKMALLKP